MKIRKLGGKIYRSLLKIIKKINDFRMYYEQELAFWIRKKGINFKYRKLGKYKNLHNGERCFIICSGPSLTMEDVEKLKNEVTFVMNTFVLALDNISYVPTYYAIQDGRVYARIREKLIKYKDGFESLFIGNYFVKKKYYSDADWVKFPQYYMGGRDNDYLGEKTPDVKFSDDAQLAVYDGGTIAYSILQLAVYMGFKNIYLLGADCEFKAGSVNDFTDKIDNMNKKDLYRDSGGIVTSWEKSYMIANDYAKKHNINIYNATRGGKLEVFKRVDLDEVLR